MTRRQNGGDAPPTPFSHSWRTRARDDHRPSGLGSHARRDGTAKTSYMSRGEADAVADERWHEAGVRLDVYRCGVCAAWHLGNRFDGED